MNNLCFRQVEKAMFTRNHNNFPLFIKKSKNQPMPEFDRIFKIIDQ